MAHIHITTFYVFLPLSAEKLERLQKDIESWDETLGIKGLFIIGPEGVNSTFSGTFESIEKAKSLLKEWLGADLVFKDSLAEKHPFHLLSVKPRKEIVTINRPDLVPSGPRRHLPPEEWEKALHEPDTLVIDTRNDYEYRIGHFKNAINPNTEEFSEFPKWVEEAKIPKDKKVLIYCTGGIRCEKAILAMEEKGYQNVYQLEGGILNYLQKLPRQSYEGECFVFDYRVAVDQELKPTQTYRLCPHCGEPAKEKISCRQCGTEEIVCNVCLKKDPQFETCSKNCAHHYRMGHKSRRIHKDAFRKRRSAGTV